MDFIMCVMIIAMFIPFEILLISYTFLFDNANTKSVWDRAMDINKTPFKL